MKDINVTNSYLLNILCTQLSPNVITEGTNKYLSFKNDTKDIVFCSMTLMVTTPPKITTRVFLKTKRGH